MSYNLKLVLKTKETNHIYVLLLVSANTYTVHGQAQLNIA